MRKTIAAIVILSMLSLVIAGCSSQPQQSPPPTSTVQPSAPADNTAALPPDTTVQDTSVQTNPDTGSVNAPAVDTTNLT